MGYSTLRFRNQSFEANDSLIQIWFFQMVLQINEFETIPRYLQVIRDDWFEQASLDLGFGYVLDLDQQISTLEQLKTLIELSQKAIANLSAYGPLVSAQDLNQLSHATESSYFTRGVAIDILTGIGEDFITLLSQTLPSENDPLAGGPQA